MEIVSKLFTRKLVSDTVSMEKHCTAAITTIVIKKNAKEVFAYISGLKKMQKLGAYYILLNVLKILRKSSSF